MKLPFTKMHGAGNDFVVLDATRAPLELSLVQLRGIADRQRGVGADQILVVGPPGAFGTSTPDIDFSYRIFNADGVEVEQCGNGARAFVRFVTEKGLTPKRAIRVETQSGVIEPRLEANGMVTVDMGACELSEARVPFITDGLSANAEGAARLWPLQVDGRRREIVVASMGNPHAVQIVTDVDAAPVGSEGPLIERHVRFPRRVNVGYMQVLDRHTIRLRVWERGAGETLACGTGACAAVVTGIQRGRLDTPVSVRARGGELQIAWQGGADPVFMTGPAVTVFEGVLDLEALPA